MSPATDDDIGYPDFDGPLVFADKGRGLYQGSGSGCRGPISRGTGPDGEGTLRSDFHREVISLQTCGAGAIGIDDKSCTCRIGAEG